jgi:predicted dehydrogenase
MGIVGMGKMGAFHAQWMTPENLIELVAICEKNLTRFDELSSLYQVPILDDLNQFLTTIPMDFVVIATTNETHEALAIKALESGKNVIVEKPMSLSHESTLRMISAARQSGKHLLVHHNRRWDRDFRFVRETIRSGVLGKILQIHSKVLLCGEGWPSWGIDGLENPWRIKSSYGGGILFDWGPHLADQILNLAGEYPASITGALQSGIWTTEVDDHFFALLKFPDGLIAQIEASNNSRITGPRWCVIGTRGTLLVRGCDSPIWDEAELVIEKPNGQKEKQNFKLQGRGVGEINGGFYENLAHYLDGSKIEFTHMLEASDVVRLLEEIKLSSNENRTILSE